MSCKMGTSGDKDSDDSILKAMVEAVKVAGSMTDAYQKQFLSRQGATTADGSQMIKDDLSPVTVADFAAQAVVNYVLMGQLRNHQYAMISEESSEDLRQKQNGSSSSKLSKAVLDLVNATLKESLGESDLYHLVDEGKSTALSSNEYFTLDPIDGTKGFIRGQQYAVCLALIRDGQVVLAAMACPNLDLRYYSRGADQTLSQLGCGVVFYASLKGGSFVVSLNSKYNSYSSSISICVSSIKECSKLSVCESVESGHSDHDQSQRIMDKLGCDRNQSVRLDSQCKYALVACGLGDVYFRLPVKQNYQEKIWDHASGELIVREAGGQVTDLDGKPLIFPKGSPYLSQNLGILASNGQLHQDILKAYQS
ncbi:hypothetical protein MIR68_011307 [Amoeboaphelidium protococcarum]|nr:hypothetical protein MIR68_011307 [Amoeboaphelidium protococcarum]